VERGRAPRMARGARDARYLSGPGGVGKPRAPCGARVKSGYRKSGSGMRRRLGYAAAARVGPRRQAPWPGPVAATSAEPPQRELRSARKVGGERHGEPRGLAARPGWSGAPSSIRDWPWTPSGCPLSGTRA
jgi:hypothetical protein